MKTSTSIIEPLEPRIAPATLVNPHLVTYTDADGDNVTVTINKGTLTSLDFTFNNAFGAAGPQQLEAINFVGDADKTGTNITITAKRSATAGGDGYAHLGFLNATGIDLGTVTVDGDLGRIACGDLLSPNGLNSLRVLSIGQYLLDTQGGAGSLVSTVIGNVGSLIVKGNIREAFFSVENAGKLGSAKIGGSLLGGTGASTGKLQAQGGIGTVLVSGSLVGGGGAGSGAIDGLGGITSATVMGSLFGGGGPDSGSIQSSFGTIKSVKVVGNLTGDGTDSGAIIGGNVGSVTIGGTVVGGANSNSGSILSLGTMGAVKVGGNLQGGAGGSSGSIISLGKITSVGIKGSILSGGGSKSGNIGAQDIIGSISIGGSAVGTSAHPVALFAAGATNPTAVVLPKIVIGGRAEHVIVAAGYGIGGPFNADASVGLVQVGRDWIASSIVAGVDPGLDGVGNLNDAPISGPGTVDTAGAISRIAKVVIGGQVLGSTPTLGDYFGIVAQQVSALTVGGTVIPLNPGPHDGLEADLGITGDFAVREVGL